MEQNIALMRKNLICSDSFFSKNLRRADFFLKSTMINRSYTIDIILLDENDQPLYRVRFDVPAYSGTQNIVTRTEILKMLPRFIKKSQENGVCYNDGCRSCFKCQ
jgi:hypothetical protein